MAIRDWFKRDRRPSAQPRAAADRRFHGDRSRMFDLDKTARLQQLFAMPREQRDGGWSDAFFDATWCGSIALAEPQTFHGPDGFPYLRLDIPRSDTRFDSQCLANLAADCIRVNCGAAFFASPDAPAEAAEFVLSMGLLDSLLRYDSPDGDPIDVEEARGPQDETVFDVEQGRWSQTLTTREAHQVLIGTPSSDYLPPPQAQSLHRHLTELWGMEDPRVGLIVDLHMRPHRSLVIGRKRSDFPEGAPIDDMVRALTWHLSPGRMLMLVPEQGSVDGMVPLRELFEGR